jgi:hypothetical protein
MVVAIPVTSGILEECIFLALLYGLGKTGLRFQRLLNCLNVRRTWSRLQNRRILRNSGFFVGCDSTVVCWRTWWSRDRYRCGRRGCNPSFRDRLLAKMGKIAAAKGFNRTLLFLSTNWWHRVRRPNACCDDSVKETGLNVKT